jgi:hypothetical protein
VIVLLTHGVARQNTQSRYDDEQRTFDAGRCGERNIGDTAGDANADRHENAKRFDHGRRTGVDLTAPEGPAHASAQLEGRVTRNRSASRYPTVIAATTSAPSNVAGDGAGMPASADKSPTAKATGRPSASRSDFGNHGAGGSFILCSDNRVKVSVSRHAGRGLRQIKPCRRALRCREPRRSRRLKTLHPTRVPSTRGWHQSSRE